MLGGILSNPAEIVFTRMQVDEMYPEQCRRNYKSFADGLVKVAEEGALFRGATANGLKLAGLVSVASGTYDYFKENAFYFFGPISLNRLVGTAIGCGTAMVLSMPFDCIKTRLHTMRPLPNGVMPYNGFLDCMAKILRYECSPKKFANFGTFYTGGQAYFARLYGIALVSQWILDYYHANNYTEEYWQPARYQFASGIDYDVHEPWTDGPNKMMVYNWSAKAGFPGLHPDGKSHLVAL